MKKNFWLLGVAVAALTSCTQNEVLEVPESKQIRFEEFVEKNSRVADDLYDVNTAKLTEYWVYGYSTDVVNGGAGDFTGSNPQEVFNGMRMYYENSKWNYTETDRWKTNHWYRFAAYSNGNKPAVGVVTYNPETDQLIIPDYSVVDASDIVVDNDPSDGDTSVKPLDLIASIAGDRHASTGDQPVSFTFRHLLAKVTFHFTNASNSADVAFNNITISEIAKTGTCVCTYPGDYSSGTVGAFPRNVNWNITGITKEDFSYGDINVPYSAGTSADEITFYVIPQSNEDAVVTISMVETIDSDNYNSENLTFSLKTNTYFSTASNDFVTNQWVAGYHYRYLITKGSNFGEIVFSAEVDTWNKDRDGNGNPGENADNVNPTPVP